MSVIRKDERQCEATTRGGELGGGRCGNRAKVKIAGSWLCGVHARQAPIPWHLLDVKPQEEKSA